MSDTEFFFRTNILLESMKSSHDLQNQSVHFLFMSNFEQDKWLHSKHLSQMINVFLVFLFCFLEERPFLQVPQRQDCFFFFRNISSTKAVVYLSMYFFNLSILKWLSRIESVTLENCLRSSVLTDDSSITTYLACE